MTSGVDVYIEMRDGNYRWSDWMYDIVSTEILIAVGKKMLSY